MTTMTRSGYDGLYKLVHTSNNEPVDVAVPHQSGKDQLLMIVNGAAPHKPGSTGRIYCQNATAVGLPGTEASYFPMVCDMKWLPEGPRD